jgi:hypothetical protein
MSNSAHAEPEMMPDLWLSQLGRRAEQIYDSSYCRHDICAPKRKKRVVLQSALRDRLHVFDSAYESLYDSKHDLHIKSLGSSFEHGLKLLVNTFQEKLVNK